MARLSVNHVGYKVTESLTFPKVENNEPKRRDKRELITWLQN